MALTKQSKPRRNGKPGKIAASGFRDRIKELRRVRAGDLLPNPQNWRTHPQAQQDALRGVLTEIGYADALLARELQDGSLMLVDGHLRRDLDPEQIVPVLVLDVTEAEAKKILATLDPLTSLAEANTEALDALLREVDTGSEALQAMLDELAVSVGIQSESETAEFQNDNNETPSERWGVYVECQDETSQRSLLERLTAEGYECRGLIV